MECCQVMLSCLQQFFYIIFEMFLDCLFFGLDGLLYIYIYCNCRSPCESMIHQ